MTNYLKNLYLILGLLFLYGVVAMGRKKEISNKSKSSDGRISEDISTIKENTDKISDAAKSKVPNILAVIAIVVAVIGILVAIYYNEQIIGISKGTNKEPVTSDSSTFSSTDITTISVENTSPSTETTDMKPYTIFLYSEYSKITIYKETNMTVTLNFDADSVSITANLASGKIDKLMMHRKDAMTWEEKVVFDETGTHEIVANAISRDGNIVEDKITVEVIPLNLDSFDIWGNI